jgi:RNA polymerase sigma-70 factor (ECF subfamily)
MKTFIDRDFIIRLQKGDTEAYEIVYKQYASLLYGFIVKQVNDRNKANDILLEVFMEIKKRIKEYDPSFMRFFTWMYQLTKVIVEQHSYTVISNTFTTRQSESFTSLT